jgi:hypothetical protein
MLRSSRTNTIRLAKGKDPYQSASRAAAPSTPRPRDDLSFEQRTTPSSGRTMLPGLQRRVRSCSRRSGLRLTRLGILFAVAAHLRCLKSQRGRITRNISDMEN